jgi:transcriptional regulator with XRE-family HTH domain
MLLSERRGTMNNLKKYRKNLKLSQKEIGDIIGVSQRGYSHYEINDREIPLKIAQKLAKFYNTTIEELIKN